MRKPNIFTKKSFNLKAFEGVTKQQFAEQYHDQLSPEEIDKAAELVGITGAPAAAPAIQEKPPKGENTKEDGKAGK